MDEMLRLPRKTEGDLFVVDGLDVVAKDDLASMEHAFYSLSKRPVMALESYHYRGKTIEYQASQAGFPTVYDQDLVIYTISCVIAALDQDNEPPRYVTFSPYGFLIFSGRSTGGRAYDALCDSVDRLAGARFRTNIVINGEVKDTWRQIIGDVELVTDAKSRKPRQIKIQLSDMLIETIRTRSVLTISRDYFGIKRPVERRIYQLVRKHMGRQCTWSPYLDTLYGKSGSRGTQREFRRSVKELVERDNLPDYHTHYDEDNDQVMFTPREAFKATFDQEGGETATLPPLMPSTYERARLYCTQGIDVYDMEADWRAYWVKSGSPALQNHNAAFIGWCKRVGTSAPPVPPHRES